MWSIKYIRKSVRALSLQNSSILLQKCSNPTNKARLCTAITKRFNVPDNIKYPTGSYKFEQYLERLKSSTANKRKSDLITSILENYENRQSFASQCDEFIQEFSGETNAELLALAEQDCEKFCQSINEIDELLIDYVIELEEGSDDVRAFVLEVSPGIGGDEAQLFADDLFQMYEKYILYKAWDHTSLGGSTSTNSILIRTAEAYTRLKDEAGVHRVQRIPETESKGRVHTSTAVVFILPFEDDIDIQINRSDLKIENTRASGPGGQSVNKSESAIRLTHLPTGIVIECQNERTATLNQKVALERLRGRLYDMEIKRRRSTTKGIRQTQASTRDRNLKIRTYNFKQKRVTDHRLGSKEGSINQLEAFLDGKDCLDVFITKVQHFQRKQKLAAILDNE